LADITALLEQAAEGNSSAPAELLEAIHAELRQIARSAMRRERRDHTLQPTALVNEAWLRLVAKPVSWESRSAFLRASAHVMREILVDHARARGTIKRGGDIEKVSFLDPMALAENEPSILLAIDAALEKLAILDARVRQVVELRYFGGLTIEETAKVLGIASKTVVRDWSFARAWLEKELRS
jgi:RNA polymerase sigma factor (TIGR02999 family)